MHGTNVKTGLFVFQLVPIINVWTRHSSACFGSFILL